MGNNFLEVEEAPSPSLILWQNLGVPDGWRYLRQFGTLIVAILLVVIIFVIIVSLKKQQNLSKAGFVPEGGNCGGEIITEEKAIEDWLLFKENLDLKQLGSSV